MNDSQVSEFAQALGDGSLTPETAGALIIGLLGGAILALVIVRVAQFIAKRMNPRPKVLQQIEEENRRSYDDAKKAYDEALKTLEKKTGGIVIPIIHDLGRDTDFFQSGKRDNTPTKIDYDEVLRAMSQIRKAKSKAKVTVVLHTLGGYARPAHMIASALKTHNQNCGWLGCGRKADVIVPYTALSGGTIIALAADKVYMGENAELGRIDPITYGHQASAFTDLLGGNQPSNIRISGDIALRAIEAKRYTDYALSRAQAVASDHHKKAVAKLSKGDVSHSQSISRETAKEEYGIHVADGMFEAAYDLVDAKVQMIKIREEELARALAQRENKTGSSGDEGREEGADTTIVPFEDPRGAGAQMPA